MFVIFKQQQQKIEMSCKASSESQSVYLKGTWRQLRLTDEQGTLTEGEG